MLCSTTGCRVARSGTTRLAEEGLLPRNQGVAASEQRVVMTTYFYGRLRAPNVGTLNALCERCVAIAAAVTHWRVHT